MTPKAPSRLLHLASVLLVGCTRPLKLSDVPPTVGVTALSGIAELLVDRWTHYGLRTVLAESTVVLNGYGPTRVIKRHWANAVKTGFAEALADLNNKRLERGPLDPSYLDGLPSGTTIGPRPGAASDGASRWVHIALSEPGFNHDSTFAVIYSRYYCGIRCAGDDLLLLARKPGSRWTLWDDVPGFRS
jgi:hypothetical protein